MKDVPFKYTDMSWMDIKMHNSFYVSFIQYAYHIKIPSKIQLKAEQQWPLKG